MTDDSPANPEPAKAPAKRSFFGNAKSQITVESGDIFGRKNRVFREILDEERRKRELKLARKQKKPGHHEARQDKKRRISHEQDDRSSSASPAPLKDGHPKDALQFTHSFEAAIPKQSICVSADDPSATAPLRKRDPTPRVERKKAEAVVIDLEGSDSEAERAPDPQTSYAEESYPVKQQQSKEPTQDDSEEEFPELAAQARERRRLRALGAINSSTPSGPQSTTSLPAAHDQFLTPNTPAYDPVIFILITSPIPNTNPLIVHRKLSQRFQEIRTLWCDRQGFSKEFAASVFLTWRNRRLYDVTTCKSLGIKVDAEGKVIDKGSSSGLGDLDGKVHVEAMTDEILEEVKKNGPSSTQLAGQEDEDEEGERAKTPPKPAEEQVRIKLKAKDYEELKLIVKPSTTFSRIADAFRKGREVPAEREIVLMFDGERLEPQSLVQDSEVSDMDGVEVHVK